MSRRVLRKHQRHLAIINIATRHFLDQGYDCTSMSAIAEEIGGSKGTLWSHFASKAELFTAVIEEVTAVFKLSILATLDSAGDPVDVLMGFAENYIAGITTPEAIALQRLIAGGVERFPEIGSIFYDRGPTASRALVARFVADMMQIGTLRGGDPDEAAAMLIDLCAGGYHQRILWGVQSQDNAIGKSVAKRAVQQFLICYGVSSLSHLR